MSVHREAVCIAVATGDELPIFAIRRYFADPAARCADGTCVTAGIRLAWQQQVLLERGRVAFAGELDRQIRVVSGNDEEIFFVRCKHDIVRAVLAAAVDFFQRLNLVEFVVAVGVDHPVKAAAVPGDPAAVHHDIQAVERPQQPLRVPDWHVDFLDVNLRGVIADLRRRDAVKVAVLIGGDQAALVIFGQRDPRALFAFRHDVQQFRLEAVGQAKLLRGEGTGRAAAAFARLGEHVAPRRDTQLAHFPGVAPVIVVETGRFPSGDFRAARAPRVVGVDDLMARGAGGDVELAHQAGDAALVPAAYGDDIAADV